jgi:uncharacterized OsmC-like protein
MSAATGREYRGRARSTDAFGRVLCSARNHHFVVDGPADNGCPGEAITPAELFLSGVASCGVELLHVIAREQGIPLERVTADIRGTVDRARPLRPDLTLFHEVRLHFELKGVSEDQGGALVDQFKRR